MPIREINHTGRKRLTAEDVAIGLHNEASPLTFEVARLSMDRHNLPGDALVRVEAYHATNYARFPLGTVGEPVLPGKMTLSQFNIPDGIKFRVKVTAVAEPRRGQLLAAGIKITPSWLDGGKESLLPVKPVDTLGQEVYQVSFEQGTVLLINDRIDQWRGVSRHPVFIALVYPSVLRIILTRILLNREYFEEDGDEEWPQNWIAFTRSHLGMGDPPDLSQDGAESINNWIDQVVAAFCRNNNSYNGFARRWEREDTP